MLKSVKSAEAHNPIRTCCWSCNFEALEELFFFKRYHGYLKAQRVREVANTSYHQCWDPQISIQLGIETCKDLSLPA
jgi:hypothetical protein